MIHFRKLEIPDLLLIEPQVFEDERGFFFESFNQKEFEQIVGRKINFVQDNHSNSCKGVLRGMHYQLDPHAQGKLVRVLSGEIFDVAVDLRRKSPTFGKWVGEILSHSNYRQMWIPEGFAHGFLTLSDDVEVLYKTTNFYSQKSERSILWNDPDLKIKWPHDHPIISDKDENGLSFKEVEYFC